MKKLKALDLLKDYIEDENRLGDLNYAHYSNIIDYVNEAIDELEALEIKDRLAELEKVILDYYLDKGYKIGADGLGFKVNITTLYKWKLMHVIFLNPKRELVFQIITETPKEMFDKAFEFFSFKV